MFRIAEDPSPGSLVQCLAEIMKYLKVLQHVSDHTGSIIREPCTVLGYKLQERFYRDRSHGQGRCYGSISKNLKIKIYRTIILPVVLYGCETWSLTLGEERRLRVFENKVLRRICGRYYSHFIYRVY